MAHDDYNWTTALIDKSEPEGQDKDLRDTFVAEYLVDYDENAAAIRCGFASSFALDYAKKFMNEPYVQKKLKAEQLSGPITKDDEVQEEKLHKRKILTALLREAHNPMISGAARVAALSRLAVIYGMDQPAKGDGNQLHRGGVMIIPAIADINDWQAAAVASQTQLVLEARS